ncbi:MAG TPA: hypothetical protein DEA47_03920 [Peptococcaceae bacterium]|nr:MAG: Uncharacterized protein XD50_0951 [Clostridia bacterium 41_269]HBT20499.1 hypothetical protein [Peptococcaceae bacterium]
MTNIELDRKNKESNIKLRVRFDYKAERTGRLLFGGKSPDRLAEEIREQKAALLRNVPIKGINIEDIDMGIEIYKVYDEETGREAAYAPLELIISADTIEDVVRFVMCQEFRKVEILEPKQLVLNKKDIERILYKMNEELHHFSEVLEKKINSR